MQGFGTVFLFRIGVFAQRLCYWLSVISDAEMSVMPLSVIFADHAWLHDAAMGMAACCAAGVGARGSLMLPDAQKRAVPLTINIANSIYFYG